MELRIAPQMSVMEKLKILGDAAKYDVSCSSSGSSRKNDGQGIGNTVAAGLCHGRPVYLSAENPIYQRVHL
jgi:predicted DNA-binding helix-hairpin-helix protein